MDFYVYQVWRDGGWATVRFGLTPDEAMDIRDRRKAAHDHGEPGHREGIDYQFLPDAT